MFTADSSCSGLLAYLKGVILSCWFKDDLYLYKKEYNVTIHYKLIEIEN